MPNRLHPEENCGALWVHWAEHVHFNEDGTHLPTRKHGQMHQNVFAEPEQHRNWKRNSGLQADNLLEDMHSLAVHHVYLWHNICLEAILWVIHKEPRERASHSNRHLLQWHSQDSVGRSWCQWLVLDVLPRRKPRNVYWRIADHRHPLGLLPWEAFLARKCTNPKSDPGNDWIAN